MHARRPILDATDMQAPLGKLHLMPLQVAHLRGPQSVPVGDQDHGRVPVAVASMLAGAVHQPLDFLPGEIPAGSALPNCQVYSGWRRGLGCWKHRGNLPVLSSNWLTIARSGLGWAPIAALKSGLASMLLNAGVGGAISFGAG